MLTIKKILCPTDFSPASEAALREAVHLCERFGAELHVMHVAQATDPERFMDLDGALDESTAPGNGSWLNVRDRMGSALGSRLAALPVVRTGALASSPAAGILRYARIADTDLIVVGTGQCRWDLVGSTARQVMRQAPCPVWITRERTSGDKTLRIGHVVALETPVKPMADELRYASELARALGAQLSVLHVLTPLGHPGMFRDGEVVLPYFQVQKAEAERRLSEEFQHSVPDADKLDGQVRFDVLAGTPGDVIVSYAHEHVVDLLVASSWRSSEAQERYQDLVAYLTVHAPSPVVVLNGIGKSRSEPVSQGAPRAKYEPTLPQHSIVPELAKEESPVDNPC